MKRKVLLGARNSVSPNEIIQLEAQQNFTLIFFKDGSSLLSSTDLGLLGERLQPYKFFRVNRSTIIDSNHLNRFTVHPDRARTQEAKSRKPSASKTNEVFLSRRRIAAFRACVGCQ